MCSRPCLERENASATSLLNIVDKEINALARNAKGLCGIEQDETGRNRLKRDGMGLNGTQQALEWDGTGSNGA